jgi:motility quorum-sensing regulator / GCU-specific mRNA interferase toxin
MEKRRPSHDLAAIKRVLGSAERLAVTGTALRDAQALGFTRHGIALTIRGIDRSMFVKSMTTYADHRAWQDVYHVPVEGLILYVKFQADAVTEFRLVSFKER